MTEINKTYQRAVEQIKEAILKCQYTAAKQVNAVQLALYYGVGKYVSQNSRKGTWGTGAIATIAEQLHKELPGLRGFSDRNIRNMRTFYEEWNELDGNLAVATAKLQQTENEMITNSAATAAKLREEQSDIQIPSFGTFHESGFLDISFTNHLLILSKVKDKEQRLFYIRLCATQHLSKTALQTCLSRPAYDLSSHLG